MIPKPPARVMPPTLKQVREPPANSGWRKNDSPPLGREGALADLDAACRIGENPNSAARFLRLLAAIMPEDVNAPVPGQNLTIRWRIEHLAKKSIHESVRRAAAELLGSEIVVIHSSTSVPGSSPANAPADPSGRAAFPGFSPLPLRIRALELLREHLEGRRPDAGEKELLDALDSLRFNDDSEVARMIVHVAGFSRYDSVRERARALLIDL